MSGQDGSILYVGTSNEDRSDPVCMYAKNNIFNRHVVFRRLPRVGLSKPLIIYHGRVDRQIDRQTDRQTDVQTNRNSHRHSDRQMPHDKHCGGPVGPGGTWEAERILTSFG